MLEKQRNTLIKKAFESAKIIAPGMELTALEIDDAAYTLNCMLQSWSNEGFHLFNMKTGYMPLISKANEYKLSTEAYSRFSSSDLLSVDTIGATQVKVDSLVNMGPGQSLFFLNNTLSDENKISSIDYVNNILYLDKPINMPAYAGDDVFFGKVKFAKTEIKQYDSGFSSIDISDYAVLPSIGDSMYINYAGTWVKVTVSSVNAATNSIYFLPEIGAGRVSGVYVAYGTNIGRTILMDSYELLPRKINVNKIPFDPVTTSILSGSSMDGSIEVEKTIGNSIILKNGVSRATLSLIGKEYVNGKEVFPATEELRWNQIPIDVVSEKIDWGSVSDVPAESSEDWGYVSEVVTGSLDFKSLTGTAEITSYAKTGQDTYVSLKSEDKGYLLYQGFNGKWASIYEHMGIKLFVYNGAVYAYDMPGGLYILSAGELKSIYSGFNVEFIVKKADVFYLVSKQIPVADSDDTVRHISSTKDFLIFEPPYSVDGSIDFRNAVEFKGKLYCGKGKTYVTLDMKAFSNINIYSDNRSVVGSALQNFNKDASSAGVTYTVVNTHAALLKYDSSKLADEAVIKVLVDETLGGATSYYRWTIGEQDGV